MLRITWYVVNSFENDFPFCKNISAGTTTQSGLVRVRWYIIIEKQFIWDGVRLKGRNEYPALYL